MNPGASLTFFLKGEMDLYADCQKLAALLPQDHSAES